MLLMSHLQSNIQSAFPQCVGSETKKKKLGFYF